MGSATEDAALALEWCGACIGIAGVGIDVGVDAGVVIAVRVDAVDVSVADEVIVGDGIVVTASAVGIVVVKADASDVGAAEGVDVEDGLVVSANAVGVVAVKAGAVDVGVASIGAGGGGMVDVAGADINAVDTAVANVVGAFESGVTTAVAVVVVDVVTVTCCDTISEDPTAARFAASRAAAGDMSRGLVVAVAVVELAATVDLMRVSPRPSVSGPEPFGSPVVVVFVFPFTCNFFNVALSGCCCFLPFSTVFLALPPVDTVAEVEVARTTIGSCAASISPSFLSASSSVCIAGRCSVWSMPEVSTSSTSS